MKPAAHSEVPHPGRWKAHQHIKFTEYEWIPDLVAIARKPTVAPLTRVPDKGGVLWLDFTSDSEADE